MHRVKELDAHHRLYISTAVALLTYLLIRGHVGLAIGIMLVWISFGLTILGLISAVVFGSDPIQVKKFAKLQDNSRSLIFALVLGAALASLFALVLLLKSSQGLTKLEIREHVFLTTGSIIISWVLVHSLFIMRYAHLYYDELDLNTKKKSGVKYLGGLEFPNTDEPDYLDFAYFSFVLGMTFQVSDVQITCQSIRRLALLHGLISFAFNTAIVALVINVVSGLIH